LGARVGILHAPVQQGALDERPTPLAAALEELCRPRGRLTVPP